VESQNVLVALGQLEVVEKGVVGLYKDATPGIVILMVVSLNLNVKMILPAVLVLVGRIRVVAVVGVLQTKGYKLEPVILLAVLQLPIVRLIQLVLLLVRFRCRPHL